MSLPYYIYSKGECETGVSDIFTKNHFLHKSVVNIVKMSILRYAKLKGQTIIYL